MKDHMKKVHHQGIFHSILVEGIDQLLVATLSPTNTRLLDAPRDADEEEVVEESASDDPVARFATEEQTIRVSWPFT